MCTASEIAEIKRRLKMVEMQVTGIQQDMTDYKAMVNEHLKKDRKRKQEFREREDFFIDSMRKVTKAAAKMEAVFNNLMRVTEKLFPEADLPGADKNG